jgi:hypothetical protein
LRRSTTPPFSHLDFGDPTLKASWQTFVFSELFDSMHAGANGEDWFHLPGVSGTVPDPLKNDGVFNYDALSELTGAAIPSGGPLLTTLLSYVGQARTAAASHNTTARNKALENFVATLGEHSPTAITKQAADELTKVAKGLEQL